MSYTPISRDQIAQMRSDAKADPRCEQEHWFVLMARAIESAATAPLLARIAELERENEKLVTESAALTNWHCESEGCAAGEGYTARAAEWVNSFHAQKARIAELEAALAEAIPAMREYARKNPKHHFSPDGLEQDPNGVHAWLVKNDAATPPPEQPK